MGGCNKPARLVLCRIANHTLIAIAIRRCTHEIDSARCLPRCRALGLVREGLTPERRVPGSILVGPGVGNKGLPAGQQWLQHQHAKDEETVAARRTKKLCDTWISLSTFCCFCPMSAHVFLLHNDQASWRRSSGHFCLLLLCLVHHCVTRKGNLPLARVRFDCGRPTSCSAGAMSAGNNDVNSARPTNLNFTAGRELPADVAPV